MFTSRPSTPPSSTSPVGSAAASESVQNEPNAPAAASVHGSVTTNQNGESTRGGPPDLWYWLGKRDSRSADEPEGGSQGQDSDDEGLNKRDNRLASLGAGSRPMEARTEGLEDWLGKRDNRSAEPIDSSQPSQDDEPTHGVR